MYYCGRDGIGTGLIAGFAGNYDVTDVVIQYNDFTQENMKSLKTIYWDVTGTTPDLEAQYNWWGDASGPDVTGNDRGTGGTMRVEANIDYEPWLTTTQATVVTAGTRYYGYNWGALTKGWNIFSTPIALDASVDTWLEYKSALGNNLDLASVSSAYYFDASASPQIFVSVPDGYHHRLQHQLHHHHRQVPTGL